VTPTELSVPDQADVIVLKRRPGPSLRHGDLAAERLPLRAPGPGEAMVRNLVTTVDPYQLRMLRGSPEVTPLAIGAPVPANSVGMVVASEDPAVPVGTQVATYTGFVVLCGWVSSYANPEDPGARTDLRAAVFKRITLRGFIVSDFYPKRLAPIREELAALLRSGRVRAVVNEFKGLDSAPEALASSPN
jgi:NADPH-dependent curcumin reductase CurA